MIKKKRLNGEWYCLFSAEDTEQMHSFLCTHIPSGAFLQQRWLTTHSYASHVCLCSLLCLDHIRAYKATAVDKLREATGQLKLGDLSFQVQKSQVISKEWPSLCLHEISSAAITVPAVTPGVSLCCTCTASSASAWWHLVCFLQGDLGCEAC